MDLILIPIKPISTNQMYLLPNRIWRNPEYNDFRDKVKDELELKDLRLPKTGSLKFDLKFGISENFDLDNCLKPFIDAVEYTYEDKYDFNDNRVSKIIAEKKIVDRGDEYIEFNGNFIPLKPFSTNKIYGSSASGHWKNKKYLKFEKDVKDFIRHKDIILPENGGICFTVFYGISFRFDLDNAIKPFMDILKVRYGFDDSRIYKIDAEKIKTKRGLEFIEFELKAA